MGDEIWDQGAGVRVRLGPLDLNQYLDFLPEGSAHAPLRAITRFFSGDEIDFEVQLILKRERVPACELDDAVSRSSAAWLVDLGQVGADDTGPGGYDFENLNQE